MHHIDINLRNKCQSNSDIVREPVLQVSKKKVKLWKAFFLRGVTENVRRSGLASCAERREPQNCTSRIMTVFKLIPLRLEEGIKLN